METLDEKNFKILIRSLARTMKAKKETFPDLDVAITWLHHQGILTRCSAKEAAKRVTEFVAEAGDSYIVTPKGYQKRLERLRQLGVIDKN
jgi:hypothetical protein